MKRFKKIVIYVVSSFLALIVLGVIFTYVFEDKVKAFAMQEINKHLVAEMSAEEIDFSFFQRFPNASLNFKNVLLKDKNDTIIFAKNLYLKMNVWDLLNKKYDVKAIEIDESKLNLTIDKYGNENYIFWKEDTSTTTENFSFNLEKVDFYKSNLKFRNQALKQSISTEIDYLSLQGAFNEDVFSMEAKSNLFIHHFKSSNVNYIKNQKCKIYTELKVDNNEQAVRVNIGDIKIADLNFVSGGYYNYNSNFMELVIQGNKIDLNSLFSVFPEDLFKEFTEYKSKGVLTFDARIKGRSSTTETPDITAEFEINNGSITENKNDITLSNLNLLGSYTSKNKNNHSEIRLKNFSGYFEDGNFSGYLTLTNLSNPTINLMCSGKLNLNTLYRFIPSNKLNNLSGEVDFNAEINAKNSGKDIQISKSEGTASFTNLNFTLTDNNLVFENLNANFHLKQNHAYVTDLSGKINSTEFTIDGYFRNFLPYLLLKNEKLTIEADVWSGKTDLKLLLGASQSATESNSNDSETPNVDMSFRIRSDQIIYGKFEASNVRANVQIIDQNIYYQNLNCNTSKGTVYANGELLQLKNGNYLFNTTATTNQVDIAEFFRQLDDFGQEYLTHKNIKGLVDTDLKLQLQLDNELNILPKTIIAAAQLNIAKGELMNVPVLDEMAQYMAGEWKIKAMIDEKLFVQKIKHIKFKDLQTSVLVQDETITIPYTEVKSDLIDISGEVKHTFEHNIDYKFNFRLRDILVQKQPDTEEFQGYEVDDKSGIRIFGQMYGTVDEPQFKFDMLSKKEYNELQHEQEKQNVKAILKDEFGLFKKDTTLLVKPQEEQQKAKFLIDWEEFDKDTTKTDTEKINTTEEKEKKKTERTNKLLKKIGAEENKEDTVKFKIDNNE